MASSRNKPQQVKLTAAEAAGLKRRLATNELSDADKTVLSGLVSFSLWLQQQLEMAKLSIRRLKKLFGVSTEKSKKSQLTPSTDDSSATDGDEHDDGDNIDTTIAVEREPVNTDGNADHHSSTNAEVTSSPQPRCPPRFDPDQNHGRYGYADYHGCEEIVIAHPTLQAGDACPACQQHHTAGRLYRVEPGVLVCLEGQPLIGGKRYQLEKLRCTVCGHVYSTESPLELQQAGKYAPSVAATLALGRYGMGLPFHRIEAWQAMQQIPMPDSTAWDEVSKLAQAVKPMYTLLQQLAAEGDTIYYDDTPNKILTHPVLTSSASAATTSSAETSSTRQGIYTTAIIAQVESYTIYVFMTTERYAGEEMARLLAQRQSQQPLVTMCDASPMNIPDQVSDDLLARWIIAFCLVHGRRQFYELLPTFDLECEFVLECIGKVYQAERHCQQQGYDPPTRLAYHQRHSGPVMEALHVWLTCKMSYGNIEENSGFGQASRYLLRHWEALTQFLRHPGVPLDNSWVERTIKLVIRHRRNSLFFRTSRGAEVGDILMSLMHTAERHGVNPLDYLVWLYSHADEVAQDPALWLPWHYAAHQRQTAMKVAA